MSIPKTIQSRRMILIKTIKPYQQNKGTLENMSSKPSKPEGSMESMAGTQRLRQLRLS